MGGTVSTTADADKCHVRTAVAKRPRELRALQTHGSPWVDDGAQDPLSCARTRRPRVARRERTDDSGILVGPLFQVDHLPLPEGASDAPDQATRVDEETAVPAWARVPEWDRGPRPVDDFHRVAARYFALPPRQRVHARRRIDAVLDGLTRAR